MDSASNVHLVYARDGKLWYRKYDSAAPSWSSEEWTGINQSASYRNKPRIALDSNDRPHVLGGQGTGTGKYGYWTGSAWVTFAESLNRDTDLAIDGSDNVYVVRRGGSSGGYIGARVRLAGANSFTVLPDPDIADGLPLGRNDHVYGSVFVNPVDDSVHVVYRHGEPTDFAYRFSQNGGANWSGGGVSGDDDEEPSGIASQNGTIFVIGGAGGVFVRTGTPSSWNSLGTAVSAGGRRLPIISVDEFDNLYVGCFGGRYNIRDGGTWLGESVLTSHTGDAVGFLRMAAVPGQSFAYAVWEEGPGVLAENDNNKDNFSLVFSVINLDGTVGR